MVDKNLQTIKAQFYEELSGNYPSEEVQSFFGLLAESILNYTRYETVMHAAEIISEAKQQQFQRAIERLKKHEPIQYIIGETEFYGLPFKVTPATLIPRPETEELVSWVIDCAKERATALQPLSILDMGTGSGCIAISLAKYIANSEVTALDISSEALAVAQQNAAMNRVALNFKEADVLTLTTLSKTYDVIVSNPPYVRELEKEHMQANVLSHEPKAALFVSDQDPLVFYRAIASLAKQFLNPQGELFFEINEYLSKELIKLLEQMGFSEVVVRKDLFGKNRMIRCEASKSSSTWEN